MVIFNICVDMVPSFSLYVRRHMLCLVLKVSWRRKTGFSKGLFDKGSLLAHLLSVYVCPDMWTCRLHCLILTKLKYLSQKGQVA